VCMAIEIEAAPGRPVREALIELDAVVEQASATGLWGSALAATALAAGLCAALEPGRAATLARRALAQAGELVPSLRTRVEVWWHAARALAAAGHEAEARAAAAAGRAWLLETARSQVPEAFRDSFLHRVAVNDSMLAVSA